MFKPDIFSEAYRRRVFRSGTDSDLPQDSKQLAGMISRTIIDHDRFSTAEAASKAFMRKRIRSSLAALAIGMASALYSIDNPNENVASNLVSGAALTVAALSGAQYRFARRRYELGRELVVDDLHKIMWHDRYAGIVNDDNLPAMEKNKVLYEAVVFDVLTLPISSPDGE